MLNSNAINKDLGLLVLRVCAGGLMALQHGWPKLSAFSERMDSFPDPLGIGSLASLILVVFSEFLCAVLITLGLFTRAASIPLIITMGVAAFVVHGPDPMGKKELSLIYLCMYLCILFTGAGKYAINRVSFR